MAFPVSRLGASGSEVSVLPEVASDLLLSPFPFPLPGRNPLSDFDHCHRHRHRHHLTLDYRWVLSGFHPSAMVAPDDGCGGTAYRCRRPRCLRCGRRFRYPWLQRSSVGLLRRPPCRPVTLFHRAKKKIGAGSIDALNVLDPTINLQDCLGVQRQQPNRGFLSNSNRGDVARGCRRTSTQAPVEVLSLLQRPYAEPAPLVVLRVNTQHRLRHRMLLPGVYSTSSGCVPAASLGAVPSNQAVASRSFEKQIFFEAFFPLLCFGRWMREKK